MSASRPTSGKATPLDAGGAGVRIQTTSRLHFGLVGFEKCAFPFGGAGMMVDLPAATVFAQPSDLDRIVATDSVQRTIVESRERWNHWYQQHSPDAERRPVQIEAKWLVPRHVGLGSGTQMALAAITALNEIHGLTEVSDEALATCAGRGERSSVGTLGFRRGGFVFERGHTNHSRIASDFEALAVPDDWRIVLSRKASESQAISGLDESRAFARLPEVAPAVTQRLVDLVESNMMPALRASDCGGFGEALFAYGELAGCCFATEQGGPYATAEVARRIHFLRSLGVAGVGQSSWGPTVFSVLPGQATARHVARALKDYDHEMVVDIVAPNNSGMTLSKMERPKTNAD